MGEKKENEQPPQGTPNPWIYDVSKQHPDQQPGWYNNPQQPAPPPYSVGAPRSAQRLTHRLLLLLITLVILVIVASIVVITLIVK